MSLRRRTVKAVDYKGKVVKLPEDSLRYFTTRGLGDLLRAKRARLRRGRADKVDKNVTPTIKQHWPENVGTITISGGKHTVTGEMRASTTREVLDPTQFIRILGDDAFDVVQGVRLPASIVIDHPTRWWQLLHLLQEHYPEFSINDDDCGLIIDWEALKARIDAGLNIPDGIIGQNPRSRSLYIEATP